MRNSKILKCISYVLIPFLILGIVLPMFYETAKDDLIQMNEEIEANFFETDLFLSKYMNEISSTARRLIFNNDNYTQVTDGNTRICYVDDYNIMYDAGYEIADYYYLIMYKNIAITNIELTTTTNTISGLRDFLTLQDAKKASIVGGNVEADSELIKSKAIQYFDNFSYNYYSVDEIPEVEEVPEIEELVQTEGLELVQDESLENIDFDTDKKYNRTSISEMDSPVKGRTYYNTSIKDFEIYTSYKEEVYIKQNDIFIKNLVEQLGPYESQMLSAIPVCSILLVVILIYLIISIGHTKNKNEIDLNDLDRIPIEIILIVALLSVTIILGVTLEGLYHVTDEYYNFAISMAITVYVVSYILCAITAVTIIKRIKAKTLIKDSLTGKICRWCFRIIKKIVSKVKKSYNELTVSMNRTAKLLIYVLGFGIGSILMVAAFGAFGFFVDLCVFAYCLYKFIMKLNCYHKIEEHLKGMYEGDNTKKLNPSDFTPEFQDVIKYINDISSGFENAIEEGIKSERLKTELITNVSHDIKTPLTSIINYVDLIKKENLKDEKIKEYVDILDNKSQRLKKLTEDLVEASKASSGNVKLNLEKLNTVELIKQSIGEFEDKFKAKNLEIITTTSDEEIFINADNRYMYRVIENLFSNISKYALDGSRVYVDIGKVGPNVRITIKNISKERLNITADELMQRFVRGDKSRTTEGSGLGISISKSLTELQKGKFNLQVDGDLFKVELEFNIVY